MVLHHKDLSAVLQLYQSCYQEREFLICYGSKFQVFDPTAQLILNQYRSVSSVKNVGGAIVCGVFYTDGLKTKVASGSVV